MRSFSLTILGSSSALPKPDRFTTAHVLNVHERFFLIDCGEGTQIQLRRYGIRFSKIHHIFISHLHGDHFFGLPGLLSSFNLMGRKKTLYIYGPPDLEQILLSLYKHMGENLNYHVEFTAVIPDEHAVLLDNDKLRVEAIPLNHKKPATGFLFKEKPGERNMIRAKVGEMKLGLKEIVLLKQGQDVMRPDGTLLPVAELTHEPVPPRSYAFVSDTRYEESIIPYVKNVDLLYHEATYLHEMKTRAQVTGHSTALEAGRMARLSGAKRLVIGHFSARYKDAEILAEEARKEFNPTILAYDGLQIDVNNSV